MELLGCMIIGVTLFIGFMIAVEKVVKYFYWKNRK